MIGLGRARGDDALRHLFRAARVEALLGRFAEALSVTLVIEDQGGQQLAAAPYEGERSPAEAGRPGSRASVRIGAEVVGSVRIGAGDAFPWPPQGEEAVAELVAEMVGERLSLEVESRGMTTELLSRYEEVNLLYDLSEALALVFDVPTLCEIAIDRAVRAVGAERATVMSADPTTTRLTAVAGRGYPAGVPSAVTPDGVIAHVAASGVQVLLHPGQRWSGQEENERGDAQNAAEAVLSVPLLRRGDGGGHDGRTVLGVLTLVGKPPGERFTAGDARVVATIATQLAAAIQNSRLLDFQRQAERAHQEVEIAAGIQRGLLPAFPPDIPGAVVAGMCVPATSVGGDYFDTLPEDTGRLTLVIADVAGHSIGSALMMAMARIILRREVSEGHGPAAVLQATNKAMMGDLVRAGLFITAFCAQYDPPTRELRYANAAHNLPLVCVGAQPGLLELDADGMPLGILEDAEYEERTVQLAPGSALLLYTDGVVEARNGGGEQFGDDRLRDVVVAGYRGTAHQLIEAVFAAVGRHLEGGTQQDDVTLLALRVGGE